MEGLIFEIIGQQDYNLSEILTDFYWMIQIKEKWMTNHSKCGSKQWEGGPYLTSEWDGSVREASTSLELEFKEESNCKINLI